MAWTLRISPRFRSSIITQAVSHPFLENCLSEFIKKETNVHLLMDTSVTSLIIASETVIGVETTQGARHADLVIDAIGRSSKSMAWLTDNRFLDSKTFPVVKIPMHVL